MVQRAVGKLRVPVEEPVNPSGVAIRDAGEAHPALRFREQLAMRTGFAADRIALPVPCVIYVRLVYVCFAVVIVDFSLRHLVRHEPSPPAPREALSRQSCRLDPAPIA